MSTIKGTHELFVVIPGVGTGFITGVPDKCKHDDKGSAFMLGNGDYLLEKDYRCPTNEATQEYIEIEAARRGTYVSGGTTCCSKCGKPFSLQEIMGDAYWE